MATSVYGARPPARRQEVYTTGQVAAVCRVSPRTVCKWIDEGLLRGYRLAGGWDRRVPRAELERFLAEHGMPTAALDGARDGCDVLVVSAAPRPVCGPLAPPWYGVRLARDAFEAGVQASAGVPDVLVLDLGSVGRATALSVAARVAAAVVVVLTTEDAGGERELLARDGWLVVWPPHDPEAVAALVREAGPLPGRG